MLTTRKPPVRAPIALCPELERYILSEVERLRIVPHGILSKTVRGIVKTRMPVLSDAFTDDSGRWHIYVWSGASARTIWSTPAVNVIFRAWHDATHLQTGLGLDPASELELAKRTIAQARLGDGLSEDAAKVLFAETAGQIEHYLRHAGAFPENQRAFVKAFAAGKWAGERF